MKESARIALDYLRSHADLVGVPSDCSDNCDIHLHVPAGAIPKDGPSAGVAITTALASLFSGRPARHDIAMTGEITLTGRVLPVGGIKEKVLAARQAGITTIILPERNRNDLRDIPEETRAELRFEFISDVRQAFDIVLLPSIDPSRNGHQSSDGAMNIATPLEQDTERSDSSQY
jgi:ATP-dependent Lon protease